MHPPSISIKYVVLTALILAAVNLSAQTIVAFNDGTTAQAGASTLDSRLTSATMHFGAGLIKTKTDSASFFIEGDPIASNWTLADALSNDYYYSIAIDAGSNSVDIASATFATFGENDPRTYYLFSDITGLTLGDELGSFTQSSTTVDNSGTEHTVILSAMALENISGSVEFRLYFTNQASASIFEDSGFRQPWSGEDFVSFKGKKVAIPEPSTAALLFGIAGIGVALKRRSPSKSNLGSYKATRLICPFY